MRPGYWQARADAARADMSECVDAAQSWAAIAKAKRMRGEDATHALERAASWADLAEKDLERVQLYQRYADEDKRPALYIVPA